VAKRERLGLTAVRTEGAILPASILQRIHREDPGLDGLKPEQYDLTGDRLREAASRAWTALQGPWMNFKAERAKLAPSEAGTTITRNRWLYPILRELHFGPLEPLRESLKYDEKEFPVSHKFGHSPLHLIGCNLALDKRTPGAVGAAKMSPHGLLQSCLNSTKENMWGFVTNGLQWRVLRDDNSLSRQSMVEFDLESIFEGQLYDEFLLFFLVCHRSRVQSELPEQCWLEQWSQAAGEDGKRALNTLRDGVQKSIEALGQGFLRHPANNALRTRIRNGELDKQDYYRQLLRMVYRLLFLFVAEDRGLLLDPKAKDAAKALFNEHFSTQRLRLLAERMRGSSRHHDLFNPLKMVLSKLGEPAGCPELALPALGGFLFAESTAPDLDSSEIANADLLEAVRFLAVTREGGRLARVDYKNLGTEELGSVYESLLELHPDLDSDGTWFELKSASGNERKTSGSYYTPDALIQCLLDTALDPVVNEAVKRAGTDPEERAKAILDLRVIDPAVGSGHFLIAAAHRLSKRLAQVRTGDDEPSPNATRHAIREVVGKCLYGIDLNPMAAELCKVSLWIEALEPGRPLSFIDHHIAVGNSLLGTTPELILSGIPDEAYDNVPSATKRSELKKQNRIERSGQNDLFFNEFTSWQDSAAGQIAELENQIEDNLLEVKEKAKRFADLTREREFESRFLAADLWVSAFTVSHFDALTAAFTGAGVTTQAVRRANDLPEDVVAAIKQARAQFRFFHPHLAFPDVFARGGFDVVIGNPPWERVKLQEKEFFAGKDDSIVNASSADARRRLIANLEKTNSELFAEYESAKSQAEGESTLIRKSGRFPLTGRGDVNTYSVFVELMLSLTNDSGAVGVIAPTGILVDDGNKDFAADIVKRGLIASVYDFSNQELIFKEVKPNVRFSLLTLRKQFAGVVQCAAQLRKVDQISDPGRQYQLTVDDIQRLNPNTLNFPMFLSRRDASLIASIYRGNEPFSREAKDADNSWGISFEAMVHMTNASEEFSTLEELESRGLSDRMGMFFEEIPEGNDYPSLLLSAAQHPLYESKFIAQFDHRANSFEGIAKEERFKIHAGTKTSTTADHADSSYVVVPRYWLRQSASTELLGGRTFSLGFRNAISATADSRSLVAAVIPPVPVGNSMPLLDVRCCPTEKLFVLAMLNSFCLDYVLRQKASGGNLNFFIMKQLPVVPRDRAREDCPWDQSETVASWCARRAFELTYTAQDLQAFAREVGYEGPPFKWDEERRFWLRAELDAAFFHLYGIDRDDAGYIMETFPIVKRKDIAAHGSYRTKEAILSIYDEMARCSSC
jgi:type I restriction-modification system DNA methylase subunit